MKIYLLKNIPNLGNKGEIKDVADGYAINYLLPQKIAQRADTNIIKKISQEKEQKIIEEKKKKEEAVKLIDKLKKIILEISLKFSKKGKEAYDPVNSKRIVKELQSQGIHLEENQIQLKKSLKKEGLYNVNLVLYPDVETSLKIRIKAVSSSTLSSSTLISEQKQ